MHDGKGQRQLLIFEKLMTHSTPLKCLISKGLTSSDVTLFFQNSVVCNEYLPEREVQAGSGVVVVGYSIARSP